jgi:hypothetical protein
LDNPRSGAEITANGAALAIPPAACQSFVNAVAQQTKPRLPHDAGQVNANGPKTLPKTWLICQRRYTPGTFAARPNEPRTEKEHRDEHDDAEAA